MFYVLPAATIRQFLELLLKEIKVGKDTAKEEWGEGKM
jgi:hypothetical protein